MKRPRFGERPGETKEQALERWRSDWAAYQAEQRAKSLRIGEAKRSASGSLDDCHLRTAPGPWDPKSRRCYRCDRPLPRGSRKWCPGADVWDGCEHLFWSNHEWNRARLAANRRDDYRCTSCGRAKRDMPCRVCGEPYPCGTVRQHAGLYRPYGSEVWKHQQKDLPLEVDHIDPRWGEGYWPGCHHHLEPGPDGRGGLRVLCRACHVRRTTIALAIRRCLERAAMVCIPERVEPPEPDPVHEYEPEGVLVLWGFPEGWPLPDGTARGMLGRNRPAAQTAHEQPS